MLRKRPLELPLTAVLRFDGGGWRREERWGVVVVVMAQQVTGCSVLQLDPAAREGRDRVDKFPARGNVRSGGWLDDYDHVGVADPELMVVGGVDDCVVRSTDRGVSHGLHGGGKGGGDMPAGGINSRFQCPQSGWCHASLAFSYATGYYGSAKDKTGVVPESILPSRAVPLPVHVMEYTSSCSAAASWCASGSIHQICWEGNMFSSCGYAYRRTLSELDRAVCRCRTNPNSRLRIT